MKHGYLSAHSVIIRRHLLMCAYIALASFAALLASSCGRAAGGASGAAMNAKLAAPRMMGARIENIALQSADSAAFAEDADVPLAPSMEDGGAGSGMDSGAQRKLIRTASISLTVSNLDTAEEAILEAVKALGGYVATSDRNDRTLSIDIKVSASRFDEAVAGVEGMGTLVNKNVNVTDVTDHYYDLDSRIRTKQILKERLESYLKASANMKDLVAVETQLNSVISDLESMQGQFKRLSREIDYSNIHIRFSLPTGKTERGWQWPSVTGKMRAFVVGAADFFSTLGIVILGLVLFGTPIVLLAALLYYITFGKLGLIKRLFKKMQGGS